LREHLADLVSRLAAIARSDSFFADIGRFRDTFGYQRAGFDLPADALDREYIVHAAGLSLTRRDGDHVLYGAKGAVTIPDGLQDAVAWMLDRRNFLASDYAAAFPHMAEPQRRQALDSMVAMKVIALA